MSGEDFNVYYRYWNLILGIEKILKKYKFKKITNKKKCESEKIANQKKIKDGLSFDI